MQAQDEKRRLRRGEVETPVADLESTEAVGSSSVDDGQIVPSKTAAAAISEALSNDYEISKGTVELDCAGSCIQIGASEVI